jgi:LuxR family transcriptional regulator, maltose regulon positive regulatory protein
MTEVAQRPSPLAPGPALLPLKLAPPPARSETILRADLQALLAEVRLQPATLVVAPAGYGKTTLLTQWAAELAQTGAAVSWLGLDENDRSPALLLAYLVRTFQRNLPDVGEQAWRVLHSAADLERDWPLVASELLGDLQNKVQQPTFLIIDDYHLIADGPITGTLLGYLLRAAPPALHIVVASRRPVSVAPLPRIRAEGALVEIQRRDLSLSREDAGELLTRAGVTLSDVDLDLLLARTEGWVLSVQLVARALARQEPDQRRAYLQHLDADQRSLFDYLATEVMADLPADLLDDLARAALADQVDAELLAEVLQRADAEAVLNRSLQLGLPISPVDPGGGGSRRYKFHPLWQRLLVDRATQRLSAAERRELERRYGAAFLRRSQLEAALTHYARANDPQEMARALRELAWPLIDSPQRANLRAWIERLPDAQRTSDPELLHMWGWSVASTARDQALAAISRAAELYHADNAHQRELRALADLAALLFWEDRPAEFAAVCVRAVRAANRVRDAWARGAALVSVVALLYSRGRYAAALRVAAKAERHPRNAFWQWLLALTVGSIHVQRGYPLAALSTVTAALEVPQVDRDDRRRQHLLRLQASALYQQGQGNEAVTLALESYQRLSDYADEGAIGSTAALLALLLVEQGRMEEAATYLARARAVANRTGAHALLARVQVLDAYTLYRCDQPAPAAAAAIDLLRQSRGAAEAPMVRGSLHHERLPVTDAPYLALATHDLWMQVLLLVVLGEGGELQRAADLAEELTTEMVRRGDGLFLAIVQFYRGVLAERRGDAPLAAEALSAGWGLYAEHGFSALPILPMAIGEAVIIAALRYGQGGQALGELLRRQFPDQAAPILMGLLDAANPPDVRARAADLIGELGVASAYAALRALLKDREQAVRTAAEGALERLVYRPNYRLNVRTLGGFGVWRGDIEIKDRDWRSVKARQLLQLLLVERGRMLPRDRIMDMLWPGLEAEAAANNLRVTLSRLTKAIEPNRPEGAPTYYVFQQGDTYGFNVESDHSYDAAVFVLSVEQGRAAAHRNEPAAAIEHFRKAISLYGGTFLPDCLYEDWSVVERERLSLLFTEASLKLGDLLLDQGQPHEAIGLAWRVLEFDQAQEEAYQLLMRAYTDLGERSTALRLYARCVEALDRELGVEPLPETVALYAAIVER